MHFATLVTTPSIRQVARIGGGGEGGLGVCSFAASSSSLYSTSLIMAHAACHGCLLNVQAMFCQLQSGALTVRGTYSQGHLQSGALTVTFALLLL